VERISKGQLDGRISRDNARERNTSRSLRWRGDPIFQASCVGLCCTVVGVSDRIVAINAQRVQVDANNIRQKDLHFEIVSSKQYSQSTANDEDAQDPERPRLNQQRVYEFHDGSWMAATAMLWFTRGLVGKRK
jgi:hypothetical protein